MFLLTHGSILIEEVPLRTIPGVLLNTDCSVALNDIIVTKAVAMGTKGELENARLTLMDPLRLSTAQQSELLNTQTFTVI